MTPSPVAGTPKHCPDPEFFLPPATPLPHAAAWPARLPRTLVLPQTTLWFNLEVSARRYPDKAASLFFGRPLCYAELHRQALALAGW